MAVSRESKVCADALLPEHGIFITLSKCLECPWASLPFAGLQKFVLPEVMRMHDAQQFSLNHEIESVAHKDEYKQYNRLQSLLLG
jgi:hypothetical protein